SGDEIQLPTVAGTYSASVYLGNLVYLPVGDQFFQYYINGKNSLFLDDFPIYASPGPGSVQGAVLKEPGNTAAEGVTVSIYSDAWIPGVEGTFVGSTTTDMTGSYSMNNIPGGPYYLKYQWAGLLPYSVDMPDFIVPGSTSNIPTVTLDFS